MSALGVRLSQKQKLFTLVADLHKRGVRCDRLIGELIGISREYARQIRIKLGISKPPRTKAEALELLDADLKRRVDSCKSATESSANS